MVESGKAISLIYQKVIYQKEMTDRLGFIWAANYIINKELSKDRFGGAYRFTGFLHAAVIHFGGIAFGGGPIVLLGFCSCPWILSLPALSSYTIIKAVAHIGG